MCMTYVSYETVIAVSAESTQQTHPEDQDVRNKRVDYK